MARSEYPTFLYTFQENQASINKKKLNWACLLASRHFIGSGCQGRLDWNLLEGVLSGRALPGRTVHAQVVGDSGEHVPQAVAEPQVVTLVLQPPHEEHTCQPQCDHTRDEPVEIEPDLGFPPVAHAQQHRSDQVQQNGAEGEPDVPGVLLLGEQGHHNGRVDGLPAVTIARYVQHVEAHARDSKHVVQPVPLQLAEVQLCLQDLAQMVQAGGGDGQRSDDGLELEAAASEQGHDGGSAGQTADDHDGHHQQGFSQAPLIRHYTNRRLYFDKILH